MSIAGIIFLGVGLSMDAFAVSLCKGISMRKPDVLYTLIISACFGAAQTLMPLLGWFLGDTLRDYVSRFAHPTAFVLLAYIGGKMILDARRDKSPEIILSNRPDLKELLMLSAATSIDALAAGVTLAFLNVNVLLSSVLIGCTTFLIFYVGVCIGYLFGTKIEKYAAQTGGMILILIGLKILIGHIF